MEARNFSKCRGLNIPGVVVSICLKIEHSHRIEQEFSLPGMQVCAHSGWKCCSSPLISGIRHHPGSEVAWYSLRITRTRITEMPQDKRKPSSLPKGTRDYVSCEHPHRHEQSDTVNNGCDAWSGTCRQRIVLRDRGEAIHCRTGKCLGSRDHLVYVIG